MPLPMSHKPMVRKRQRRSEMIIISDIEILIKIEITASISVKLVKNLQINFTLPSSNLKL